MNPPLPTTPIGRTGITVARLGLGTAPLGNWHTPTSDEQAVAVVRAALAAGMNLVDSAPLYGAGLAERRLGAAIADLPRERVVISTKVGRLVQPDGGVIFDFSRDGVLRSHEASLKRLGVDRIDVLLIHDPDDHERQALDEAFPALAELRAQGAIGAIGAGMNQWQMLADFARNADFDCFLLAGRYTLLEQTSLEFLELCRTRGIGVFLGGVFNSGILATGPRPGAKFQYEDAPPAVLERAGHIEAVCRRHDVPLATAALQFAAAHPAVTALVVGGVTALEVETNRRALTSAIPGQLWDELRAEGLIHPEAPAPQV
jgi:D-threo-aldose 1-dehydrogenase